MHRISNVKIGKKDNSSVELHTDNIQHNFFVMLL